MVTLFPSALQLLPECFRTAPLTKHIPSQTDADQKFFFRICVNLRNLRAKVFPLVLCSFAAEIFSSKIAKRARLELEARTGKNVVTGENHLPPASAKNIRDLR